MQTKICTKCGRELPATSEYFFKAKMGKFGLNPVCKTCIKSYRAENKLRDAETKRRWYQANKSRLSAERKEKWLADHPKPPEGYKLCTKCGIVKPSTKDYFSVRSDTACGLSSWCKNCNKLHREANLEKNKKRQRDYYENNAEVIKEKNLNYRKKNIHKVRIRDRKYYENNKEKLAPGRLINVQKRLARKRSLPNTLTAKEWQESVGEFEGCCAYCGRKAKLAQDHFWPLSKGGGYTATNIVPACTPCNASKNNKPFEEWYPTHESYSPEREAKIYRYFEHLALKNGGWGRSRPDLGTITIVLNERQT